jgi:hypothetical protein
MVRKHQTRNLEIPGSMLKHRPGMTASLDGRYEFLARSTAQINLDFISCVYGGGCLAPRMPPYARRA